ncbi:somatic embryogenesis receptor kinase 1-like protein [Tanacetum coccineum]
MNISSFLLFLILMITTTLSIPGVLHANGELKALMLIKQSLDPENTHLTSWTVLGNQCDGSFDGVACNENGLVANISLQGKGLSGKLSPFFSELKELTGLYLHYNKLTGGIPKEIANLTHLNDLYLNVNYLSGFIPLELGNMVNLQALKRLAGGFQYGNNLGLCGVEFAPLRACSALDKLNPNGVPTKAIPETADLKLNCSDARCSRSSKTPQASIIVGVVVAIVGLSVISFLAVSHFLNRAEKHSNKFDHSDGPIDQLKSKVACRKNGSPLINLEYPNGWDPLAEGRRFGGVSQEIMRSFRFNLEEIESATQYFAPKNLLGKSVFSAIHKGMLRDGTIVAIKSIIKSSCKSEESEFLKGLNILTSLRHENLVRLRGFCCSKGRGECFLIYDFVPNGNLLRYLDMKDGDHVLDWSTRASIINGIAKGKILFSQ